MKIGALIERGPADWQILQQQNGAADVFLEGSYVVPPGRELQAPTVFVRIVWEDSGALVRWWQPAETDSTGHWRAAIRDVPAGGLYRLETCLAERDCEALEWQPRGDMVHHFGIGDLFLIVGQSNSAGYGRDSAFDPPELGVHLLRNSGRWDLASHPFNDSTGSSRQELLEGSNPGSSPYLNFGKTLMRRLHYPIGFLQAALGGSPLSAWDPGEDGWLYRNMLEVLRTGGGRAAGVLWYQGCTDADQSRGSDYLQRFRRMVDSLRRETEQPLPFLTFQLNRCTSPSSASLDLEWGLVREAQRQASRQLENVWVLPTTDCGLSDGIHNRGSANLLLGERLADAAFLHLYGFECVGDAPDLEDAVLEDPIHLRLRFSNVKDRLYDFDADPEKIGFTVTDHAGAVSATEMLFQGTEVLLTLERPVQEDCRVSGGWQQDPAGILPIDFATHLPILSFCGVEVRRAY